MNFYSLFFLLVLIKLSQTQNNTFYIYNGNFKYKLTAMPNINNDSRSFIKNSLNAYKVPIVKIPYLLDSKHFMYNTSIIFYPYFKRTIIDDGNITICTMGHCLINTKTIDEMIICCSDYFYCGLYINIRDYSPVNSIRGYYVNTYTYYEYDELSNISLAATDSPKNFFTKLLSFFYTSPKIIFS